MRFARLSNHHVIFTTHAVISNHVNARLVGERHRRLQNSAIAANEIGAFVPVHSDAMAEAMRKIFIARTHPRSGYYFSSRIVHRAALMASDGCRQSGLL